ncbi:MAG: DUF167 domain-containing protein [Nitrospirales bacterium]|nr:DUF167 domain-containing protein [Nitrospirales bacterium]
MKSEPWATEKKDGVELKCLLQPRAAQSQIMGIQGGEIKIRIQAPPLEGRANEELCQFLSKRVGVPQRSVQIVSGASSRHKRILIKGKTLGTLQAFLLSLLNQGRSGGSPKSD